MPTSNDTNLVRVRAEGKHAALRWSKPRSPGGSFAEYSCDIGYIPAIQDWQPGEHRPEDSFYLWGPQPPADFTVNHEAEG